MKLWAWLVAWANRPSLDEQLAEVSKRDSLRIENLVAHNIALRAENALLRRQLAVLLRRQLAEATRNE